MNKTKLKKITRAILRNTSMRIMLLLTALFIAIGGTLLLMRFSFQSRIENIEKQIQDTQTQISTLQSTVNNDDNIDDEVIQRQFASYEEIVPFIGLLENLFGLIDPKAQISIKNEEKQILANRYADYEVILNLNGKKTILFKALDELYRSKYLTRIMSFKMGYSPLKEKDGSEFREISFTIRLYFE